MTFYDIIKYNTEEKLHTTFTDLMSVRFQAIKDKY